MDLQIRSNYPYSDDFEYTTQLTKCNLEKEMEKDLASGKGFLIKEPQNIKKTLKDPNSIFSDKYMKTLDDPDAFIDRYACECGITKGIDNNRLLCPYCHTEVKYIGDDFEIFGWIRLKEPYKIIHPELFKELEKFIGKNNLHSILEPDIDLNENGQPMTSYDRKLYKKSLKKKYVKYAKTDNKYKHIGMMAFMEKFDEIIEYFRNKNKSNKNKIAYYEDIIKYRDIVFTGAIPVYSTGMRPFKVDNGTFTFERTNATFNIMAKMASNINKDKLIINKDFKYRNGLLYELQVEYDNLYTEIEKILAGKKGNIRLLIGGRCSFTVRSIIVPDPTLRIDEIRLPYNGLLELLQQTIINILANSYNYSYAKAYSVWYKAQISFNQTIYDIVENLIKYHNGIPIIVNRNPSINFGSIVMMRCIGINKSFTMSMPLQVLPGLAADFDGDCLTALYIPNKEFCEVAMNTFNPRNNMIISHNDGKFNNQTNLYKDILIVSNSVIGLGRDTYTEEELQMIQNIKDKAS